MSEPILAVELDDRQEFFQPGDVLSGEYRLDGCEGREIKSVELSIFWRTEGKGDEDRAVHYSETRKSTDDKPIVGGEPWRFSTPLPLSPLSYDGLIVKILWRLRATALVGGWRDREVEIPFRLGDVAPPREDAE